jgi:hypothetical protein
MDWKNQLYYGANLRVLRGARSSAKQFGFRGLLT